MGERFRPLPDQIVQMVRLEGAAEILEIGNGDICYGNLIADCQNQYHIQGSKIDRILLTPALQDLSYRVYHQITTLKCSEDLSSLGQYDFILVTGRLDEILGITPKACMMQLLSKARKQVMLILPEFTETYQRPYHPLAFLGMVYAYSAHFDGGVSWQVYQFFRHKPPAPPKIDLIPSVIANESQPIRPMHIAVVIPHQQITGGMKAYLEIIKRLTQRGHIIDLYYRGSNQKNVLPEWGGLTDQDYARQCLVPPGEDWLAYITDADLIFLTISPQIRYFMQSTIPVVIWEQGYELLFGEYPELMYAADPRRLQVLQRYHMPIHVMSVSPVVQKILKDVHGRITPCCPCGINVDFYHPAPKTATGDPIILLVGHPSLRFKGFKFAFDVLTAVWNKGLRFQVVWASPVQVIYRKTVFPIEIRRNLPQEALAALYAASDILFSTSLYEAYSLPPLEAMASQTAVVAMDNGGINSYAKHQENCLLCPQGDFHAAVDALSLLLLNPQERARLAKGGRETALEHASAKTICAMERHLHAIIHYRRSLQKEEQF